MRNTQFSWMILVCMFLLSTVVVAQDSRPLTNQDIIKMVKAGLPENTIVLAIQKSTNQFDKSPDALIALKEAGATQKVLDAILQAQPSPSRPFRGATASELEKQILEANSRNLKVGTYKAKGVVETITSSGMGSGMQSHPTLKIKIKSIDDDSNVEAEFIWDGQIGRMKGRIDATGKLKLEGYLDSRLGNEWHILLTTTVENSVLTNGKYTMKSSIEAKGVFPTSEPEDDN